MPISTKRSPEELAALASYRLQTTTDRLCIALQSDSHASPSRISVITRVVAIYADTGIGPPLDELQDTIAELVSYLYDNPSRTHIVSAVLSGGGADPLGQSIDAATARIAITLGEPVPLRLLAALADLSLISVRKQCVRGALDLQKGCATASSAAHWLGKRGVFGYEKPVMKANRAAE